MSGFNNSNNNNRTFVPISILKEQNHVKKEKKALLSYVMGYVIGQRNSLKKLDSLDQSGILLCHKRL